MRQLTSGGCCTRPFWSVDDRYVQFIDRPASRPLGIYGVDVEWFGSPTLIRASIVSTSPDGRFLFYPDGDITIVQRVATSEKYPIVNGGRQVAISPDGQRLLWQVFDRRDDFDKYRVRTWVANIDGSGARMVGETLGISQSKWIDSQRILLVGLPLEDPSLVSMASLKLGTESANDELLELARVSRPRETLISPGGDWLVFVLAFQMNSGSDGIWIVPTDGSQPAQRLSFFGSLRWRDDTHLLYVPMELDVDSHALWEYDAKSGESRRLTNPERTRFKIANNDWAVSHNGRYVAFVSAFDHNVWLIELLP